MVSSVSPIIYSRIQAPNRIVVTNTYKGLEARIEQPTAGEILNTIDNSRVIPERMYRGYLSIRI